MSFNRLQTLPTKLLNAHIADAVAHITADERSLWNDKSYITSGSFKLTAPALTADAVASIDGHGHGIADINGLAEKLASVLHWKGTIGSLEALNALTGMEVGDVYVIGTAEYAYDGTKWEQLGPIHDFSGFATTEALSGAIAQEVIDRNAAIKVVSDQLADDKAELAEDIAANATAISNEVTNRENAIAAINGATVLLTGYASVTADDVVKLNATDSVNTAFRSIISHLNTLDSLSGGTAGDLSELTGRVTTAEGEIDALQTAVSTAEGEIDVLQAATAGFDGTNTVAAAIAAAQGAAEAKAAELDGALKTNLEGQINAVAGDLDVVEAATAGFNGTNTVVAAISAAQSAATAAAETKAGELDAALKSALEGQINTVAGDLDVVEAATAGFNGTNTVAAAIATAKGEAQSAAEATASADATAKANAAQAAAIAAAETKAGELDSALHTTITGEIATAKGEAIADAEGKLAAAKSEIDGRLDAIEAIEDHGAKYVTGAVGADVVLADLEKYAMDVTYTAAASASITLPSTGLVGRGATVSIIIPATGSVTVSDGTSSETITGDAEVDLIYVFKAVMTGADTFAWKLYE